MSKAIVWTIAGSDPSGGAGIQADLHTFQALGVHGCSVLAALTAQNSRELSHIEFCSPQVLEQQLASLSQDLTPQAIKLGMIGSLASLKVILPYLDRYPQAIVYDPVLFASVGGALHQGDLRAFLCAHFLKKITVLTPNIPEAEWLLDRRIQTHAQIEQAAKDLRALGPQAILLKGGHAQDQALYAQDYWQTEEESGWLTSPRSSSIHRHGTGCTMASAIAACLAQAYELKDALVLAKAYINQGIRLSGPRGQGRGTLGHAGWPNQQLDYPSASASSQIPAATAFPSCGPRPLGFYPIVNRASWVERLLATGVSTIQLRIKDLDSQQLKQEIKDSIALASQYQARLFINDYWQAAIEYGAYGVHLGQEDLIDADFEAIKTAGLRLGLSTHSYYELARALAYQPSYLALGPIYPTKSKIIKSAPQGLNRLQQFSQLLDYPLVAIGGITRANAHSILAAGAQGIAVIGAVSKAADPEQESRNWLHLINTYQQENTLCPK